MLLPRSVAFINISLDRQRNLNDYVGYVAYANPTIAEMLYCTVANMEFDIERCIRHIEDENIDYKFPQCF